MAGSTSNTPVYLPISTLTPVPTIISPIAIPNTYKQYVNSDDHFSIYLPPDWTTNVIEKSESTTVAQSTDDYLPKIVYLFDKVTDTSKYSFFIYGVDLKDSPYSTGGTSWYASFNDGVISGFKKEAINEGNTNIIETSHGYYSNYGNHESWTNVLTYNTNNGVKVTTKIITIKPKSGSKVYVIYYNAIDYVYANQIYIVDTILPTFSPLN